MSRFRSLIRRPWLLGIILFFCLAGTSAVAYLGWSLLGDDADGTVSTPELVDNGGGSSGPEFISGGASAGQSQDGRLTFRLSQGQAGPDSFELLPPAQGTPLSQGEVQPVLDRLPSLTVEAGDQQDFLLPPEPLPPPQPGQTVDEPWPVPPAVATPPAASDAPLEVLRFAPEGEIPLAPFLSVTFNQPMVALDTVESLSAEAVPVTLNPPLPGVWRWLGTQTLTFEYQGDEIDRFPMATEYVAEIPAGTTSALGNSLAETVSWRFSTPPLQMQSYAPSGGPHDLEPVFFISFDQRIDPAALLEYIRVTADGDNVAVQLASEAEIEADERVSRMVEYATEGRWLAFRAAGELPSGADVTVTVQAGAPSAEGPLTTDQAQSYSFYTYYELRVEDHRCSWYDDECPPFSPFVIDFNNPIDVEAFDPGLIQIEPALAGARVQIYGDRLEIQGATRGRTTYRVTVDGSIQDIFGQTLGDEEVLRFKVGSAPEILSGPDQPLVTLDPSASRPIFSVYTINYSRLDVRVYAVEPDDWPAYIRFRDEFYRDDPPPPPGREVLNESIEIDGEDDIFTEVPIDLSDLLDGDYGHLVVVVEPPSGLLSPDNRYQTVHAWVQVTQIGVDAFADPEQLIVWTTDLQNGAPLADVNLTLLPGGTRSATTGGDGLASFDIGSGAGLIVAGQGDDTAILPANPYYWDTSGWHGRSLNDELRWYIIDDRQMYKPGEEVHVKGWLRQMGSGAQGDVGLPPQQIEQIRYAVMGPQYNEITGGVIDVNAFGGFDLSFELPENSNLGYANLTFRALGVPSNVYGEEAWHGFQIQEFRRPEFEVSARNETAGPYFVGDFATVAVEASYFAGGPLPNAETSWTVCSNPGSYSPPNWSGFTFGTWTPWWYDFFYDDYYYEESFGPSGGGGSCESFAGSTDAAGEDFLRIDFEALDTPRPFSLSAEATVFDVNRQAWSASTGLLVHPAKLYVGLRSERSFVRQGEPMEIETIVSDIDGSAVSGRPVTVEAARLEWVYSSGRWTEEAAETQTCTVTSADEPVLCTFDTETGGTYEITATVEDEQGRLNQSQFTRWVSGGSRRPNREVEQEVVNLIPDKEEYAPGDTAEILVQSPFGPAEGLLTVSRGPILYTESFQVGEEGHVLRIPIEEEHIPNLNIQVDLAGAATRTDDEGEPMPDLPPRPAFASGRLNLNISTHSRSLNVQVAPATARLEPGSETAVDVLVTDANGQPVAGAELAVIVVDESILALTNYQLRDPLSAFYSSRGSMVDSTYGRSSIILANPQALAEDVQEGGNQVEVTRVVAAQDTVVEEAEVAAEAPAADSDDAADEAGLAPQPTATVGDGSAGQDPIQVRTNFNPLAAFAPEVTSDANGQARVEFQLPDNLTRYRIMVVAVAGENQFGAGESNLTARLPLMVRPSAPRFLNFGDRFELPVVIQNQTDEEMAVDVVVQAANIELVGGLDLGEAGQVAGSRVIVPANDRVEVRFPATTLSAGTARFQIAAVSGPYADAATVELPVYTPATSEAFATYGVVDEGAVAQPLARPEGVFPQFGGLEIQTSSTALQALTDAVLYLVDYRYDYTEPIASRILAVAALRDVLSAFEAEGLPGPEALESAVQGDIEALQDLQNNDGGWPYWERGRESIPFHTIHAAHALQQALLKGFDVSQAHQQQSLNYLRDIESYYPHWYGQQTRWTLSAYALYVRDLMGDTDRVKAARLLDEAGLENLSLEALAWIWPVLDGDNSYNGEVAAIGDHFNNRVVETAAAANFTTSYGDDAYLLLHSNRRTDGLILSSLIEVQPESDLIPKVVNGLLAHRVRGRWGNTQENVFILLALDRYFNTFENQTPDFVARIWLGDTYAGEHVYEGRTTERHETLIPMSYLVDGAELQQLILDKEGPGRLYYRLGLTYAPDDLFLDPLDMGFTVRRTYEAVDDPDDVFQDDDGVWHIRAGARVRVKIEMVATNRRYHVALVDPLPAGLEIINPALAVSGDVPQDPDSSSYRYGWWWWGTWYQHQNMRDERAEAFTTLLWDGVYSYSYVARATTPGTFVVPPAKAEEMYSPEVFGRSSSDWVIVE